MLMILFRSANIGTKELNSTKLNIVYISLHLFL